MPDTKKLSKLAGKKYRDRYLKAAVRRGIAVQIEALREKLGLTQKEFGEKIGKKQSVISRLEDPAYGKVSVQTLLNIATALDVALVVRFASYPEFLDHADSIDELQPPTSQEALADTGAIRLSKRRPKSSRERMLRA